MTTLGDLVQQAVNFGLDPDLIELVVTLGEIRLHFAKEYKCDASSIGPDDTVLPGSYGFLVLKTSLPAWATTVPIPIQSIPDQRPPAGEERSRVS